MFASLACLSVLMSDSPEIKGWVEKIPGHLAEFRMVTIPSVDGKSEIHIAETELTWDVYDIFAYRLDLSQEEQAAGVELMSRPSKPYGAADRGFGHKGFPAIGMTENSAKRFCEWLSKKTGKNYRLPTLAEWQHAARAGAKDVPNPINDFSWNWDNADDKTQAVGKKKMNAWGLYDMLGNVSEWVTKPDGTATTVGGHFYNKPKELKFDYTEDYESSWQESDAQIPKSKWWLSDGDFVGMRVVCDKK